MKTKKLFFAVVGAVFLTAAPLYAQVIKKAQGSHFFELGLKFGHQTSKESPVSFGDLPHIYDKEYDKLQNAVENGDVDTEDYKKNFEDMKEFYRGLKKGLSSYKPPKGSTITTPITALIIRGLRVVCDCLIKSNNHKYYFDLVNVKMDTIQKELSLTTPAHEIGSNHGTYHGHNIKALIEKEAYGMDVSDDDKKGHQKSVDEFFEEICSYNTGRKKQILRAYFDALKENLEDMSIDEILEDITSDEKASQIKKEYLDALKKAQEGLAENM